jgi:WXG100 family type VII secretion target
MSGYIKVTPEQLHDTSSKLSSGASAIETTLGDLSSRVSSLGAEWAGQASGRFQELYAQWQQGANQLREALMGISQLTAQAGAAYQQSEEAIAASFGRG